jgi:hypothetical protein
MGGGGSSATSSNRTRQRTRQELVRRVRCVGVELSGKETSPGVAPSLLGRQARRVGDKAVAVLERVGRERQLGEAKKRCGGSETPRMTVAVANSKAP